MRNYFIITVLFVIGCGENTKVNEGNNYKYLELKNNSGKIELLIFKNRLTNHSDSLQLLNELMSLEGNNELIFSKVKCYNVSWSFGYRGKEKDISLQVWALFKINEIFIDSTHYYSPFPVIINKKTRETFTVEGSEIKTAFKQYKAWLRKVELNGFNAIKNNSLLPLDENNKVGWFMCHAC